MFKLVENSIERYFIMKLTKEQLKFLKKHNVDLEYVFDAEGMSKKDYHAIMKQLNKYVAFNVSACSNGGHTLKTRNGHCVQCNPAYLEFQRRHDYKGIAYIAESKKNGIIKVGFTKDIKIRSESLNRTLYAGYSDWQLKYCVESIRAGEIENLTKSFLKDYSSKKDYNHDGHIQQSYETFKCSLRTAKNALEKALNIVGK